MQQHIVLNRVNLKYIEAGLKRANEIGFDNWQRQTLFSWNNQQIIKELISLK